MYVKHAMIVSLNLRGYSARLNFGRFACYSCCVMNTG